ncbi:MAG: ECF transporter S component [Ruminococcus sp.]|nr:ECF transporter S component [Ruminococcus sp.]
MKTKSLIKTRQLVILGMMTALVLIFSLTPIGSIPIGPLSITLNVIPVAVAAVAIGPAGGAIIGGVFGIFSFLQCFGVGVPSAMGEILVNINPFLAFIQRFIPRLLDGFLVGIIFKVISSLKNVRSYYVITGIVSALFGFALFMSGLFLINYDSNGKYKMNDAMRDFIGDPSLFIFTCIFISLICFGLGYLIVSSKKLSQRQVACAITGFCTALLNTIFFMSALVILFGNTDYMKGLMDGKNVIVFIVTFVGVNALFEMITTTLITAAVGSALFRAKLIGSSETSK